MKNKITLEDIKNIFELPKNFKDYKITESKLLGDVTNKKYFSTLENFKKKIVFEFIEDQNCKNIADFFNGIICLSKNSYFNDLLQTGMYYFNPKEEKHSERIKKYLFSREEYSFLNKDEIVVEEFSDIKSSNKVFKVIIKEEEWFVKTFSKDLHTKGLIDPNELFLYKILEYIELGPEVKFLIQLGSSSQGNLSSIITGNYIMTKSVPYDKEYDFFLDDEDCSDLIKTISNQKEFASMMSSSIVVCDILSAYDVFGYNPYNYGITTNKNFTDYNLKIIDHLPDANNGIFTNLFYNKELSYSPRLKLYEKITGNNQIKKDNPIIKAAIESRKIYSKKEIEKDVSEKIEKLLKTDVVNSAFKDIEKLIEIYSVNFVKNGLGLLKIYKEKIFRNIETYNKTLDYYPDPWKNFQNNFDFIEENSNEILKTDQSGLLGVENDNTSGD